MVVLYFSLISFKNSLIFNLTSTSSPIVGSSRNKSGGLWMSAAASSHLILCPSESFRTGLSSRGSISRVLITCAIWLSYCSSETLYTFLSSLKDSWTAISHQSWDLWPKTTPIVLTNFSRSLWGFIPFTITSPLVGVRIPVSIFMVVDFPAPFSPI